MASYNRVILLGNLTRDVELRYTQGGTAVTDIGLAVNDRRKSQSGEWIEETTFVEVTFWGRTAEVASEYLSKGSPVLVEGRLKLDTWESDGQKRSKLHVICERMQLLGGRSGSGPGGNGPGGSSAPPPRQHQEPTSQDYGQPTGQDYGKPTGGGSSNGPSRPSGPPEDEIPF